MSAWPTLTNRWVVLALLVVARVCYGLQFQSLPPLVPDLVSHLDISYAQVGLLIGIYVLPGTVLALPGGLLGQRFGSRAVLICGLALMVLGGLLLAQSRDFELALAGRLVSGVGGVLTVVQQTKVVTDRFVGREIATAMSILLAGYPVGIALALGSLGYIAQQADWPAAVHATTLVTAVALLLTLALFRNAPPADHAEAPDAAPRGWLLQPREFAQVAAASVVWTCLNAGFIVFLGFTPLLLTLRGHTVAQAGLMVSLVSWISIVSMPLFGVLLDRTGRTNLFVAGGSLLAGVLICLIPLGGPALLWMVLYGVIIGASPGGVMSLPAEVLRPQARDTGLGVFYSFYYLGLALVPPIAGYLRDATGTPDAPVIFGGLMMMGTALSLGGFRLVQRRLAAG